MTNHQTRIETLPPDQLTVGDRLWQLRKHLGCSQAVMASLMGVAPLTYSAWEQDRRRPSKAKLTDACRRLARAGKISDHEAAAAHFQAAPDAPRTEAEAERLAGVVERWLRRNPMVHEFAPSVPYHDLKYQFGTTAKLRDALDLLVERGRLVRLPDESPGRRRYARVPHTIEGASA